MTSTIFTPLALTGGNTYELPGVVWIPSLNDNKFVQVSVSQGTLAGAISVEHSPDQGTTWLPIAGLTALTSAGGPYAIQVKFDKLRVKVAAGAGAGTAWYA